VIALIASRIRRWIQNYGLVAYNTHDGLAIKITETDLREFSERLKVYVDWESADGEGRGLERSARGGD
jgi:hypothetical protein